MENNEVTKVEELKNENFDMALQIFDKANVSMDKLNNSLEIVGDITKSAGDIANIFVSIKEIDKDIKTIDAELEKFMKNADNSLEKFKTKSAIVEKQLDNFSDRLDTMLNKAMAINTASENQQEIELRTELLKQVKNWGDTMSSILTNLLAS